MSGHTYRAMGEGEPETFRCRVYDYAPDGHEQKRAEFVERLYTVGVIDCPAYDPWVEALQQRGWLPDSPELEPNPDGPGRVGRWRLTEHGRSEWRHMRRGPR